MVATSKLSRRAGGLITYFLILDVCSFAVTYYLIYLQFQLLPEAMAVEWHVRLALYSSKILIALFSIPSSSST